jgi:CubicO group peptidase (beta-lactamase class C family)
MLEAIYHQRLDSLLQRRVFGPLGMSATSYLPGADQRDRIAPTEMDPWRGRVLRGEVQDENAALMDGVSGHAGLFGSAEDLLTFAEWLLEQADGKSDRPADRPTVRPSVLQEFTRRQNLVPGSSRALGWDTPSPGGSAGSRLSPRSFGHTGFTGTSLWIDPEHHLAIILLSNRVNPTRDNPRWAPLRGKIADLVMTTLFEDAQ